MPTHYICGGVTKRVGRDLEVSISTKQRHSPRKGINVGSVACLWCVCCVKLSEVQLKLAQKCKVDLVILRSRSNAGAAATKQETSTSRRITECPASADVHIYTSLRQSA